MPSNGVTTGESIRRLSSTAPELERVARHATDTSLTSIGELLQYYTSGNPVNASVRASAATRAYQDKSTELFRRDYRVGLIDNTMGEYCSSYPLELVILEAELPRAATASSVTPKRSPEEVQVAQRSASAATSSSVNETSVNSATALAALFEKARFSRVHGRFVVPTILFRGKNLCRSSTISVLGETIFNQLHAKSKTLIGNILYYPWGPNNALSPSLSPVGSPPTHAAVTTSPPQRSVSVGDETTANETEISGSVVVPNTLVASGVSPPTIAIDLEAQRAADIELLAMLHTKHICDLMVETRKKKLGLTVTSSEKVERERYRNFDVNAIPYPGCEFFKLYKDNDYNGQNLVFDWRQGFCNAELSISSPSALHSVSAVTRIAWDDYKTWDLVTLTQNYMLLLRNLTLDTSDPSGVLVHCISGWDRTPMFVSLLRLSLWADGEVHQTLSPHDITFLTVAYDWMLFGHQLNNRLSKGEDVFYFTFYFLQFITDSRFSVHDSKEKEESSSASTNSPRVSVRSDGVDASLAKTPIRRKSALTEALQSMSQIPNIDTGGTVAKAATHGTSISQEDTGVESAEVSKVSSSTSVEIRPRPSEVSASVSAPISIPSKNARDTKDKDGGTDSHSPSPSETSHSHSVASVSLDHSFTAGTPCELVDGDASKQGSNWQLITSKKKQLGAHSNSHGSGATGDLHEVKSATPDDSADGSLHTGAEAATHSRNHSRRKSAELMVENDMIVQSRSRSGSYVASMLDQTIAVPPSEYVYGGSADAHSSHEQSTLADAIASQEEMRKRQEAERRAAEAELADRKHDDYAMKLPEFPAAYDFRPTDELTNDEINARRRDRLLAVQHIFLDAYHLRVSNNRGAGGAAASNADNVNASARESVGEMKHDSSAQSIVGSWLNWLSPGPAGQHEAQRTNLAVPVEATGDGH